MFFKSASLGIVIIVLFVLYFNYDGDENKVSPLPKTEIQKEIKQIQIKKEELPIVKDECKSYVVTSAGKICLPESSQSYNKSDSKVNIENSDVVVIGDFSAPKYYSDSEDTSAPPANTPPVKQDEVDYKKSMETARISPF